MICEKCGNEHDETYGSGRFCCQKCARSFSSFEKREETNKKVSKTLKGRPSPRKGLKSSYKGKRNRKCPNISKALILRHQILRESRKKLPWGEINQEEKRIRVLEECNFKCEKCQWNEMHLVSGKPLVQVHHIDGNRKNLDRDNLQVLCPNCHALTGNFTMHGRKGRNGKQHNKPRESFE